MRSGATRGARASAALLLGLAACTPPVRQFDLKNRKLTCEEANEYSLHTLESMGFTVTAFERAAVGRPGALHATREDRGSTQDVTIVITCSGSAADVDASEDGRILGQLDFKRAFYLGFTGTVSQAEVIAAAQRAEATRPLQEKKGKGLQVLIQPVRGQGAKLDFNLDLAVAGVLPVRFTINNSTPRAYNFDPADIVLIRKDGERVNALAVADVVQRVIDASHQQAGNTAPPPLDGAEVAQRLQARLLDRHAVSANQTVKGYLFFPLAQYAKGRVSLEDQESEETEGFVVEF